ncbi:hypothetical protein CHELA40_10389 [Chelatococcus asaccharovorans]|nr:hypothetical protein CHELA40_10389 [Chelatococcus asaccharovorans]CAH1686742.1 hypothetical protein CHELA17_65219 [Chelatococcus asaccharovorans]
MQEMPGAVIHLTAADAKLVLFKRDLKLILREASHREGYAEFLRLIVTTRNTLDVIGRITIGRRFGDPV